MDFRKECDRAVCAAVAAIVLVSCFIARPAVVQGQGSARLKIAVVKGEAANNNVALGSLQQLVVQVRDENDQPVSGANVTFLLPEHGPGGTFFGAYNKLTVATDDQGTAAANSFQPNLAQGRFQIIVTANQGDRQGAATINQTNLLPPNPGPSATAEGPGLISRLKSIKVSPRTKKIAAITAGAIVVLAITAHGGDSSSTPTVPGTSVIPGTVSVGTPR